MRLHGVGVDGTESVPRRLNLSYEFWEVILHPQEDHLLYPSTVA